MAVDGQNPAGVELHQRLEVMLKKIRDGHGGRRGDEWEGIFTNGPEGTERWDGESTGLGEDTEDPVDFLSIASNLVANS